ncbi:transcriptional regulator, LysR family [Actinosynnema mirum DSM 43827]|uniref:Transcriptional regulator, LysR family n=1 Tax=Actinosynnema mirum (strain ATCC 29888 / DSM 43827 / JCM 3225 / NBRC 14064 / NCIMB 13271 / NRRL B-12336 / IMRU 3971 / 101) TaxID=446462 RepID=C6W819_ACTMD|nr:transcriptional regulator, LysR family [Actinosynnema mirum DSM 43827]
MQAYETSEASIAPVELRHLRYFVTIAEEQNFRRAAERLHVSQSPLSRQMKDLQDELGVALFEQAGRGVRLTAAGKVFADRARGVLAGVDAAVEEARDVARGRRGTVAIGFEQGATFTGALASLMAAFRRRAPRVALQLVPMGSAEQWTALRDGTIAFACGSHPPTDADLSSLELTSDHLGLLVALDHPLASRAEVRLHDLAGERIVLGPREVDPRLHAQLATATRNVPLGAITEVADLEVLLALVAIGDGVTFLARRTAALVTPVTSLVWLPIGDLDVRLSDVAVWRTRDADLPVVRALVECAQEVRRC